MLPKDINNITEPVYKRLKKDIDSVLPNASEGLAGQALILDSNNKLEWGNPQKAGPIVDMTDETKTTKDLYDYITANGLNNSFIALKYKGYYSHSNETLRCTISMSQPVSGLYTFNIEPEISVGNSQAGIVYILSKYNGQNDGTKRVNRILIDNRISVAAITAKDTTGNYELVCESGTVKWAEKQAGGTKLYKHEITVTGMVKCYIISNKSTAYESYGAISNDVFDGKAISSISLYQWITGPNIWANPSSGFIFTKSESLEILYNYYNGSDYIPTKITIAPSASFTDTVTEL